MKLKELKNLWGTQVAYLISYSKKYQFWFFLVTILDIFLVFGLTFWMFYNNISYQTYGFVIICICILVLYLFYTFLSQDTWESYKFFEKFSDYTVEIRHYEVTAENLYSVLYCIVYKRLKVGQDFEYYKECMINACNENNSASRNLMKYLKRYEKESGNLTCYIITKGKKQYFIDFVTEDTIFISEEEN